MSPFRNLTLAALAMTSGLALTTVSQGPASASPTPPRIVATPKSQMVNQPIKLVGTGFKPSSTLTIKECSKTGWIVGQNPCDSNNALQVTTNSNGAFTGTIVAELCPAVRGDTAGPASPYPAETCFAGEPVLRGVDTVTLLGAAKITVTYP